VQATVRTFDAQSGSGDVLLDDGTRLAFDAAAFRRSGLRMLRTGQRVRLLLDAAGRVEGITLATFPDPPLA
jgi:2-phospho-L-lactate guanylyltransferase